MILHKQPAKPWTKHDFILLEAYQILDSERCGKCGLPRYICSNDTPGPGEAIRFHIKKTYCYASAAIENREEADWQKFPNDRGVAYSPEPYSESDRELASYREPYYREMAKRRADNLAKA